MFTSIRGVETCYALVLLMGRTVRCPYFFCLDVAGNILITDSERDDVKILSPSGHLIHEIGKEGEGRGEFSYPCGICLSELGIIFVISWNGNFGLQSF